MSQINYSETAPSSSLIPRNQGLIFNQNSTEEWQAQIENGLEIIKNHINGKEKPFSGISPAELAEQFRHIDLTQPLPGTRLALEELDDLYLQHAVYFHHPKYLAHLNCPTVVPAQLAELFISAINSSVDTWDQSAGGTLIEQKVIDWTLDRIQFGPQSDGIFTSGGTQSNLMAMLLARDDYCKRTLPGHSIKYQGLPPEANRWRIFSSQVSHFSIQKSAALLGLGYDAVVPITCDSAFRMDINALKQEIARCHTEGLIPIAIVATAGTTDFGSIDPLNGIADICRHEKIWMHVDAAYGCGLLVSPQHRQRIDGIQLADSVTVDYHKSFFQPVSCSAFLLNDQKHFEHVTCYADYLNPLSAKLEGTPNLVNKSIQTTRRFDALKMWLTLRIMGQQALGELFDTLLALTTDAHQQLVNHPNIEALHHPELSTLVFRFVPRQSLSDEQIDGVNADIRKAIFRAGSAVIAGTKVNQRQYLKFTLLNPMTTQEDIADVISLIVHYGKKLSRAALSTEQGQ
ncbi:pyridoxal phosphate-dependent decarboxylase family protein [Ewingella sp. S1.OA.A_B6]